VTAGQPTHRRVELRVPVSAPERPDEIWEMAATVHLPDPDRLVDPPAILVCLPGGGYNRRYFDLDIQGYSQAEYHAGQGTITVALDYIGAGDSTIPPSAETMMAAVASTTDEAVRAICARLSDGTLDPGFPPVGAATIIGIGQSMGGFAVVATQAAHHTFDGIAVMGASMVETQLPQPLGKAAVAIPPGTSVADAAAMVVAGADWRYAFYWEDVSAAIVAADADGGLPIRMTAPEWGSKTIPGMGTTLVLPGIIAAEAAMVDVPVLVAMGERDVCCAPMRELAAFASARDRAMLVVPRMGAARRVYRAGDGGSGPGLMMGLG
jgi:pimeloyl-ACP methyl ester carboxylesterase